MKEKNITLKEFGLIKGNHFVVMQYYKLVFNRTFLVLITDDYLIALKTNGFVSVEVGDRDLVGSIVKDMVIRDDLDYPYSYIKTNI